MQDVTVTFTLFDICFIFCRSAVFLYEWKTREMMQLSSLLSAVHMQIMNINQESKIHWLRYQREHKLFSRTIFLKIKGAVNMETVAKPLRLSRNSPFGFGS